MIMGRKSRATEPSLDDPRWRPVQEEYKLITQCSGHKTLALLDLNETLANNRVQSMRRHTESGERQRLHAHTESAEHEGLFEYWGNHKLLLWSDESLVVVPRRPDPPGFVKPVRGFAFFLWHPDVVKVWPALQSQTDEDDAKPVLATPGTKPRGDWPTKVGAWLILKAVEDPRQLENIDALVEGAMNHLQQEIDWAPQTTARIRMKILDFLQLLRR
jgi:hypothetical protein